jgi:hypothetical protein
MKRVLPIFAVIVAFGLAASVLLLAAADDRRSAFRVVVLIVGITAVRALVKWHSAHPPAPEELRRPRRWRWPWRRSRVTVDRRGTDRALHLASISAGDVHRVLRPMLQDVADERLRSAGSSLDDPGAADLLEPLTWDLVRPDRPTPHDLRAAGLAPREIERVLTDLEHL